MIRYVNVYKVTQEYGGPEEGGWWYMARQLLESLPVTGEKWAASVVRELEKKYGHVRKGKYAGQILGGNPDDLNSAEDFEENDMTGVETGEELEILVEDEQGKNSERPHYE